MKINDIIRKPDKYNKYFVSTLEIYRDELYCMPSVNYYWFDTFVDACKYYAKNKRYVVHQSLGVMNKQSNDQFVLKNTQWDELAESEQQ